MSSYIPDGQTRDDGFVAAAIPEESGERLYDALEFSYRPATRIDNVRLDAEVAIDSKNRDIDPTAVVKAEQRVCKWVADRISAWNLKNVGIHSVPVSAEACERMNPILFGAVYRIIRGVQASDKKPDAAKAPATDQEQVLN